MIISAIEKNPKSKKIEFPTLYQDINVLLAELVGWKNLDLKNDIVMVSQANEKPQKFDFFDTKVIHPIAQKYNKKADKLNDSEWACEYINKEDKKMIVISKDEETVLALAVVLEFCL